MSPLIDTVKTIENSVAGREDEGEKPVGFAASDRSKVRIVEWADRVAENIRENGDEMNVKLFDRARSINQKKTKQQKKKKKKKR